MSRRRQHSEEHENHERWLVSYADFITLLFAFFVVMFASSHADNAKIQKLSESVSEAFANGGISPRSHAMQHSVDRRPEIKVTDLSQSLEHLRRELKPEIDSGKLQVSLQGRGLVVSLKEAAFFPSGDATISRDVYPIVGKLAVTIQKLPNPVRLEGHTDSIPIHNERFASNWHLSTARSIAMLELLTGQFQIPGNRFAVAGYADTIPLEKNETNEGRARNRRVDLTILNAAAAVSEPGA